MPSINNDWPLKFKYCFNTIINNHIEMLKMSSKDKYDNRSSYNNLKRELDISDETYNPKKAHYENNRYKVKEENIPIISSVVKKVIKNDVKIDKWHNDERPQNYERSSQNHHLNNLNSLREWTEHVSRTGRKYYFNMRTEISQWERPQALTERETYQKIRAARIQEREVGKQNLSNAYVLNDKRRAEEKSVYEQTSVSELRKPRLLPNDHTSPNRERIISNRNRNDLKGYDNSRVQSNTASHIQPMMQVKTASNYKSSTTKDATLYCDNKSKTTSFHRPQHNNEHGFNSPQLKISNSPVRSRLTQYPTNETLSNNDHRNLKITEQSNKKLSSPALANSLQSRPPTINSTINVVRQSQPSHSTATSNAHRQHNSTSTPITNASPNSSSAKYNLQKALHNLHQAIMSSHKPLTKENQCISPHGEEPMPSYSKGSKISSSTFPQVPTNKLDITGNKRAPSSHTSSRASSKTTPSCSSLHNQLLADDEDLDLDDGNDRDIIVLYPSSHTKTNRSKKPIINRQYAAINDNAVFPTSQLNFNNNKSDSKSRPFAFSPYKPPQQNKSCTSTPLSKLDHKAHLPPPSHNVSHFKQPIDEEIDLVDMSQSSLSSPGSPSPLQDIESISPASSAYEDEFDSANIVNKNSHLFADKGKTTYTGDKKDILKKEKPVSQTSSLSIDKHDKRPSTISITNIKELPLLVSNKVGIPIKDFAPLLITSGDKADTTMSSLQDYAICHGQEQITGLFKSLCTAFPLPSSLDEQQQYSNASFDPLLPLINTPSQPSPLLPLSNTSISTKYDGLPSTQQSLLFLSSNYLPLTFTPIFRKWSRPFSKDVQDISSPMLEPNKQNVLLSQDTPPVVENNDTKELAIASTYLLGLSSKPLNQASLTSNNNISNQVLLPPSLTDFETCKLKLRSLLSTSDSLGPPNKQSKILDNNLLLSTKFEPTRSHIQSFLKCDAFEMEAKSTQTFMENIINFAKTVAKLDTDLTVLTIQSQDIATNVCLKEHKISIVQAHSQFINDLKLERKT